MHKKNLLLLLIAHAHLCRRGTNAPHHGAPRRHHGAEERADHAQLQGGRGAGAEDHLVQGMGLELIDCLLFKKSTKPGLESIKL